MHRQTKSIISSIREFLSNYDIVISSSTSGEAPRLGEEEKADPSLIWTLCRVPSVHVPLFKGPNNLPFGVQCITRDMMIIYYLDF